MSTYAELAARGDAVAVFWAEIWGIPYAFSDGVVTAAHFADGFTETLPFTPCLQMPEGAYARSIDPLSGAGAQGAIALRLVDLPSADHPDGLLTWLFGADRTSILRSRLTADVPLEAGPTDLQIASGLVFAGASFPLDVYIGLETLQVQSRTGDTLHNGVRSRWHSPVAAHVADTTGTWPEVTDHPTRWLGRVVTLYQSYLDGAGALASTDGTPAGARAAAFRIRGVLRRVSEAEGVWTLDTHSIDTLAKRQMCRHMPRAKAGRRVILRGGIRDGELIAAAPTTTPVLDVQLVDPSISLWGLRYEVDLPNGVYSREGFLEALNLALDPATLTDTTGSLTFQGTLSFALEQDAVRIVYRVDPGAVNVRSCAVRMYITGTRYPVDDDGEWAEMPGSPWHQFGVAPDDMPKSWIYVTPEDDATPTAGEDYATSVPCTDINRFVMRMNGGHTLSIRQAEAGYVDESAFSVGDFAVLESGTGPQACVVTSKDGHTLGLRAASPTNRRIVHEGEMTLTLAHRPASPAGFGADSVLSALLSTGVTYFNADFYDVAPAQVGIALPHKTPMRGLSDAESVIDIESFERFFSEAGWAFAWIIEALYKATDTSKWLADRLAFLGGFIGVRNGRITAVRGLVPLLSRIDATIDEDDLLPQGRTTDPADHLLVIDGVGYECNWDLVTDKPLLTFDANVGDGETDGADNAIRFKDHGIIATPEQLGRLALDVLGDHAREAWRYRLVCDRLLWSIEPGCVVRVSDEGDGDTTDLSRERLGLPSPYGTRGLSGVSMLVLAATLDFVGGRTELELAHVRRRRTGIAPSAWISSFTNVGAAVLTCEAQVFRPAIDGVDAAAFAAGDKVRILRVNPTQAGAEPGLQTSEGGLTVASVSGNTITLTSTLTVAWVSGTTPMVLVLDPYQTAGQTDAARRWAHAGDSSGDIGDTGDPCYEW